MILIVKNNLSVGSKEELYFKKLGFKVIILSDYCKIKEIIDKNRVDIIISERKVFEIISNISEKMVDEIAA